MIQLCKVGVEIHFSFFFAVIFPWTEKVAEKLNFVFFDKNLLAYYKRLVDTVIKNKKEAKIQANCLNYFSIVRFILVISNYSRPPCMKTIVSNTLSDRCKSHQCQLQNLFFQKLLCLFQNVKNSWLET